MGHAVISAPIPLPVVFARAGASLCAASLIALGGNALAQPPEPATVGRDRPLTSTWLCENERNVLVNAHPRRPGEEAWLTYAGTRVAIERVRRASDVAYASADEKVKWVERGNEAMLAFDDLLNRPILCRRQEPAAR